MRCIYLCDNKSTNAKHEGYMRTMSIC